MAVSARALPSGLRACDAGRRRRQGWGPAAGPGESACPRGPGAGGRARAGTRGKGLRASSPQALTLLRRVRIGPPDGVGSLGSGLKRISLQYSSLVDPQNRSNPRGFGECLLFPALQAGSPEFRNPRSVADSATIIYSLRKCWWGSLPMFGAGCKTRWIRPRIFEHVLL